MIMSTANDDDGNDDDIGDGDDDDNDDDGDGGEPAAVDTHEDDGVDLDGCYRC